MGNPAIRPHPTHSLLKHTDIGHGQTSSTIIEEAKNCCWCFFVSETTSPMLDAEKQQTLSNSIRPKFWKNKKAHLRLVGPIYLMQRVLMTWTVVLVASVVLHWQVSAFYIKSQCHCVHSAWNECMKNYRDNNAMTVSHWQMCSFLTLCTTQWKEISKT